MPPANRGRPRFHIKVKRVKLEEWCERKGWSMSLLARKLQVEHSCVYYWNLGRTLPHIQMLFDLCVIFKCSYHDMLEYEKVSDEHTKTSTR